VIQRHEYRITMRSYTAVGPVSFNTAGSILCMTNVSIPYSLYHLICRVQRTSIGYSYYRLTRASVLQFPSSIVTKNPRRRRGTKYENMRQARGI